MRVDFSFSVSSQAKKSPVFAHLKTETASLVDNFQKNLKAKIILVTELEVSLLKTQLKEVIMINDYCFSY